MSTSRSPRDVFAAAALVLTGAISSAEAPPVVSSQPQPERDFRLFVGLDVEVSQDEHYGLIEDYINNRVRTDFAPNLVSLRNVDDIRFTYSTKLSRAPITIANLDSEQIVSTVGAALEAMRNQAGLTDYRDGRMSALQSELNSASAGQFDATGAPILDSNTIAIAAATNALTSFESLSANMINETDFSDQLSRGNENAPAALRITADISSPMPVTNAYIIGVARISTVDSVGEDVLFFSQVKRLDEKPRRIEILKEGLPEEFEVLDIKIHIYRNGQELVTNQSAKQFALTRQETMEYLALEHRAEHRGQSRPPEPAWSLAPAVLFAHQHPVDYDYPLTVHVDASGQVTAIDSNMVAPPAVKAAAQALLFRPALADGLPVAGIAFVNLRDFYP